MLLGELLVAQGLVSSDDIEAAVSRQNVFGGRISENLIALKVITKGTLDAALRKQYELARAILAAEDLLRRTERNNGGDHPLTNRHRSRLATALIAGGRFREALGLAQTALTGLESSLGSEHFWCRDAARAVGDALAALGRASAGGETEALDSDTISSPRERPAVAARVGAGEQHATLVAADDLDAARAF
jgi:hypothetical protein